MLSSLLVCASAIGSQSAWARLGVSWEILSEPPFSFEVLSAEVANENMLRLRGRFQLSAGEVLLARYREGDSPRTRKFGTPSDQGARSSFAIDLQSPELPFEIEFSAWRPGSREKPKLLRIRLIQQKKGAREGPCKSDLEPIGASIEALVLDSPIQLSEADSKIRFDCISKTGRLRALLGVEGSVVRPGWTLAQSSSKKSAPNQNFLIDVPIEKDQALFQLTAVGPKGEVAQSRYRVKISDPEAFEMAKKGEKKTSFSWSLGIGVSGIEYEQGASVRLSQKSLTLKTSAEYALHRRWSLGGNVYTNVLTLSSNLGDVSARFLGANLRLSFDPKILNSPSSLWIGGGLFFSSMTVTRQLFGITTSLSAYLFPSYSYIKKNGSVIGSYFKLVPIGTTFFDLSLLSREIALGVSYTTRKTKSMRYSFGLDYSNVLIRSSVASQKYLQTLSLGVGVVF
jgi:hypothetical protein